VQQVEEVKSLLTEMKISIPVIVKIEKGEALAVSSSIIDSGDGVMVARGDLGCKSVSKKYLLPRKKLFVKQMNAVSR